MPRGVYKRTKAVWNKGLNKEIEPRLRHSPETRKQMSESHKGKTLSTKYRRRISKALKGRSKETHEYIAILADKRKGHPVSNETRRKISDSLKGRILWNKGMFRAGLTPWNKGFTKENHPSLAKMGEKETGDRNVAWKGDEASYSCIHKWVRKNKTKPKNCEQCGEKKKRLELSNTSGEYKRDVDDYRYLCIKCHKAYDCGLLPFKRRQLILKVW